MTKGELRERVGVDARARGLWGYDRAEKDTEIFKDGADTGFRLAVEALRERRTPGRVVPGGGVQSDADYLESFLENPA